MEGLSLAAAFLVAIALLFAAPVFAGSGLGAAARWSLAGTIGPLVGDMALQRIGILGYGVGLPIASVALTLVFRRDAKRK